MDSLALVFQFKIPAREASVYGQTYSESGQDYTTFLGWM